MVKKSNYGSLKDAARTGFAIYKAARRGYNFATNANQQLRQIQRSAVRRSHPRDFLVRRAASNMNRPPTPPARYSTAAKAKGAAMSQSAGFLRTRRQGPKRKLKGSMSAKGIHGTYEHSQLVDAATIAYVGHATTPRDIIFRSAWQAILKQLLIKIGYKMNSITDSVTSGSPPFTVGDVFRLEYYLDAQQTAINITNATVIVGITWKQIADVFASLVSGGSDYGQFLPVRLMFLPGSSSGYGAAQLNLQYGMLSFSCKSSLKLQNRTLTSLGNDESDDVDNSPLYGKTIGGKGTGVEMLFPNSSAPGQVVAQNNNGIITKVSLDTDLLEPLSGFFFPKSTQQGKIHLDPGQLKTSVLKYDRRISLAYLFKLFSYVPGNPVIVPFGNYRFFQLERMIDISGSLNMKIAMEHNLEVNCVYQPKYNWTTAPVYETV